MTEHPSPSARRRARLVSVLLVTLTLASLTVPLAAAGNNSTNVSEKAPYYDNTSTDVANESWMAGHERPTLHNVTSMLTRVGTFIIGDTSMQGADASAGPIVTGIVLFGVVAGTAIGGRVGAVGGGVMGVVTISALVTAAVAPHWIYALVMLAVGGVLTVAIIRALR